MIPTSAKYKAAMAAGTHVSLLMRIGVGIDVTAPDDVTAITGSLLPMSSRDQALDSKYDMSNLCTFEGYGIPTADFQTVPPLSAAVIPIQAGLWSDVISSADGSMDWTLSLTFSRSHSSALTLFTQGPHITHAVITYSLNGAVVATEDVENTAENIQVRTVYEYDAITVRVLSVDDAYRHIRISEIEFGASVTLSNASISGSVNLMCEVDPTWLTIPLNELTFQILNEDYIYDFDSPEEITRNIGMGIPVLLTFKAAVEGGYESIACGRFIIRSMDPNNGLIRVTADDSRVVFNDVREEWSIPVTKSMGDAFDDLCESLYLAHSCDQSLYSLYPPRTIEFGEDSTYMEDLVDLLQLMDLQMVPDSGGYIVFRPHISGGDYGSVSESRMFTYPLKQTNFSQYNYICVRYGSNQYDIDLRPPGKSEAVNQLLISNPLVQTEAEARAIAESVAARLHSVELIVDWTGDPSVEVGDTIAFPGRWSEATSRVILMQEMVYDGGMSMRTTVIE